MKRLLFLMLVLCTGVQAAERPTVAVLPFGIAKDRSAMRWMGQATASSLSEALRRTPAVRVLSSGAVVHDIRAAGIDPDQAAWVPDTAVGPLGQWLHADRVIIGAVGRIGDRGFAEQVLQESLPAPVKGTQLYLAARLIDAHSGEILRRVYVEGRDLQDLQRDLLMRLGDALGLTSISPVPMTDPRAYRDAAHAEQMMFEIARTEDPRKRDRFIKNASKSVHQALRRDPNYAVAHAYQGMLFFLQNRLSVAARAFEAAAALDPAYVAPHYGLADVALREGDPVQALSGLNHVIDIAPWDDEAHHAKGLIHHRLGHMEQALASFITAIDLAPRRHESHCAAGNILLQQGQVSRAVEALQRAVDLLPGETAYQLALADALMTAGQVDRARAILDRMVPLSETDTEYRLLRGEVALHDGHLDEAIGHFIQVQEAMPDRADVWVMLGQIYIRQARYDEAIDAFSTAKSRGATLSDFALPFGEALEARGKKGEAEDIYRQVLEQTPEHLELRLRLVKHLLARHARREAIEALKIGVQNHPDRSDFHAQLADLYAAELRYADAAHHYERALSLGLQRPGLHMVLAELYLAQNQPDRAKAQCQKAIDANRKQAAPHVMMGRIEERLDNLRAALAAYRQALAIEPRHVEARDSADRLARALRPAPRPMGASDYAARARRLLETGDLAGARAAFEQAVAMSPNNAMLLNDLGTVYARLGDPSRAENAFQKASRLAPKTPESLFNLGRLYSEIRRFSDAEAACREALALDAGYLPAQRLLGAIYLSQGEPGRALATYQHALGKAPEDADLHLGLGNARLALGDLAGAEQAYAAAQTQRVGASAIGLGNAALARGDTAQAIAHYRHAAEQNDPAAFVNLGAIHLVRNKRDLAAKAYQQAFERAPNDRDVLIHLAILNHRTGQYDQSLEYCRKLQALYPGDFESQRLTGMVAHAAGQYELALIAYRGALDLRSDDSKLHQGLAVTLDVLKDSLSARGHWERWLDLVRDDPAQQKQVQQVMERLKRM